MANAFKRKVSRQINGSTRVGNYVVPVNTQVTVIGLIISNTTQSAITVDCYLNDASSFNYYLLKDAPIPAGGSIVVVGGDQKVVMEPYDAIFVHPSTGNGADAVMSILEIT